MNRLKWVPPITALAILLPIFLFLMFGIISYPLGLNVLGTRMYDILAFSIVGNLVVGTLGIIPLWAIIYLYILWRKDEYWRDLRYKMGFYLYHSKVKRGDRIPLAHLAEVGLSTVHDIAGTLLVMIRKGELKGRVDEDLGIYIHMGMTRKGIKLVQALPPMKKNQLEDVKRFALKDASIAIMEIREEEEKEKDERREESRKGNKVLCPDCGKANKGNTHFCTFCGEVLN